MKTTLAVVAFLLTELLLTNASWSHKKVEFLPNAPDDCSADYSPYCTCFDYDFGRRLSCDVSTSLDFDNIRNLLNSNAQSDYHDVTFSLTGTVEIPRDVLGGKSTGDLYLRCLDSLTPLGGIDAAAFQSTSDRTTYFRIDNCDLQNYNFSFMVQFPVAYQLDIYDASLDKMNDLPYLPALRQISIVNTKGFESWYTPSQTPNLEEIVIIADHDLDDQKMDSILTSMTENFVYQKLTTLFLSDNALTRVPTLAFTFPNLIGLYLNYNVIKTLDKGSVNSSYSNLEILYLSDMQLATVETGAFVGNFSSTFIDLSNNPMTSFPSSSFRGLLKSMFGNKGSISIEQNPIEDDCELAWLIVDNRDLLPYVIGGAIANGTRFEDLDPTAYYDC